MKRRTKIEIIAAIVVLFIGYCCGNKWQFLDFKLELTVNIIDLLTLVATTGVGIYIACIIEKEVQDKRIEKDMYLLKINDVEHILNSIEEFVENKDGSSINYKTIVSLEHRCKLKLTSIFKHVLEKCEGKIETSLKEYDDKVKNELKDLRQLLTQTSVGEDAPKDVIVKQNVVVYSSERASEILTKIDAVENLLLDVKVLINNM